MLAENLRQMAAKKGFSSDLGRELMVADDGCKLRPRTCIPSGVTGRKWAARDSSQNPKY